MGLAHHPGDQDECHRLRQRIADLEREQAMLQQDLSALRNENERLRTAETERTAELVQATRHVRQYAQMIAATPDAVSLVDRTYTYRVVNQAYLTRTGKRYDEIVGYSVAEVMGETVFHDLIKANLDRCLAGETVHYAAWFDHAASGRQYMEVTYSPSRDATGAIVGVLVSARDRTEQKQAEEALHQNQVLLQGVLEHAPVFIFAKDLDGRLTLANRPLEWLFQVGKGDMLGKTDYDFHTPEIAAHNWAIDLEVQQTRQPIEREEYGPGDDGTVHTYLSIKFPLFDDDGNLSGTCGIATDITERKRMEEALRESEINLRTLIDNTDGRIWAVDADYRLIVGNEHFLNHFSRALGSPPTRGDTVLPPDFSPQVRDEWRGYYDRALQGESFMIETTTHFRAPAGTMEYRFSPIRSDNGTIVGVTVFCRDITERKQAEAALRESEALLQGVIDYAPSTIYIKNTQGRYIQMSRQGFRYLGLAREQVLGQTDNDLFAPDVYAAWQATDHQVLTTGKPMEFEVTVPLVDGVHSFIAAKFPIFDDQGEICALGGTATDITERKQAEAALRESQRFIQHITDIAPYMIYVFDLTRGYNTFVNAYGLAFFGCDTLEELQQHEPSLFATRLHPDDSAHLADFQVQWSAATDDQVFQKEYRLCDAGGEWRWLRSYEVVFARGDDGLPTQIMGAAIDITERKQAEEALRESEARYRTLVNNFPNGVVLLFDHDLRYLIAGGSALDVLGLTPAMLEGHTLWDATPPEVAAIGEPLYRAILNGTAPLEVEQHYGEHIYRTQPVSLRNEQGEIVAGMIISQDITERKQAEAQLTEAWHAAEAAARTKAEFLANMSHEIRTPMNGVIGMTTLLSDTNLDADQRTYVESIRTNGDALLTLINDILDFSKIEAGRLAMEHAPFNLRDCVEQALEVLAPSAAQKQITLAYFLPEQMECNLVGDSTRVRQILINLVSNGVKFTEQGEVVVEVTTSSAPAWVTPDNHEPTQITCHIRVRDTGIGIPADHLDTLFQSFCQIDGSTTRKYGGTGLGLTISKRLAEMMDGTIRVESEVGIGSTFHVTITAQRAAPDAVLSRNAQVSDPQTSRMVLKDACILIVDEHSINRTILTHHLLQWGSLPIIAVSANEARVLLDQGERFDAAIIDMQRADPDGLTLVQEMHANKQPTDDPLPIILWTTLDLPVAVREQARTQTAVVLPKPIRPALLYDTLVNILTNQPVASLAPTPALTSPPIDAQMAQRLPLRILLAEDNPTNQTVALGLLGKLGYRADVAATGIQVITALEEHHYDVVLMDVQMPEMDGIEATRFIRSHWSVDEQPRVIAMTAHALKGDREWLLSAGMDDYLSKPVRIEDLAAALAALTPLPGIAVPPLPMPPPAAIPNYQAVAEADTATTTPPCTLETTILEACLEMIQTYADETPDQFLGSFLDSALMNLVAMQHAVEHDDARELMRAAHALCSSSAQVGALALSAQCADLEMRGKQGILEGADDLVSATRAEFTRVRTALSASLNDTDGTADTKFG